MSQSQCRFKFDFAGSGSALVEKIRAGIHGAGGRFDGSDQSGDFALPTPIGEFHGSYSVQGGTIWVDINEKPLFVPCSAIEAKLMEMVKRQR